jgi:hypothetical protein
MAVQPSTRQFLSPASFDFSVKKLPETKFFVQSINIPGISLGETQGQDTPFLKIPIPGDHIVFNELTVTFRVDEDLNNYLEVYNWLTGIGFPEAFNQYAAVSANVPGSGEGIYSDGTLMILNSAKRPNVEVTFEDMYPTSMTDLNFTTTISDIDYLEASVTFRYKYYKIRKL